MNNPSTQAESLEIDNIGYKEDYCCQRCRIRPCGGIPVMSQAKALKTIMKWSDKEIKENLKRYSLRSWQNLKRLPNHSVCLILSIEYTENLGAEYMDDQPTSGPDGGMGGGSMGGGGDFGGGLDSLGTWV